MSQLASAFKYISAKGLVHCDLKLENLLLDHQGKEDPILRLQFTTPAL
jgi:serine/threonine protein kinase